MFRYFVILAVLAQTSFANVCDFCDCQPNNSKVFSIMCDCQPTKNMQFTSSMMMGIESAAMVIIKNCQIVSIERNSFSQLEKLDTLSIQNCENLYLASGAFANLNSLLINNVKDISFGEMALMGARGIKNININYSNITNLPTFALYDIQGVEKFSLNGVKIERIHKHAVNVSANTITLENTKIDYTEANGVVLKSDRVIMRNSEFLISEQSSINITAKFHIRLLENQLNGFYQLNLVSPFVEFYGNTFKNFDASILDHVKGSRLLNNSIYHGDYQSLFQRFDYKDFRDNQFVCKCGMNLLNISKSSTNYEVLKTNYCLTNCSLSMFEFEVESTSRCMKDGKVEARSYCNYKRTAKSDPRFKTTAKPNSDSNRFPIGKLEPRYLIGANEQHDVSESDVSSAKGQKVFLAIFGLLLGILVLV